MKKIKRYKVYARNKRGWIGVTLWDAMAGRAYNAKNIRLAFEQFHNCFVLNGAQKYFNDETLLMELNSVDEYKSLYPEEFV